MINTICLMDENRKDKIYNVILSFELKNNLYYVYSDKVKEDGFIKAYAGIYQNKNGIESLIPIENDDDWQMLEEILAKIDKEG